MEPLSELNETLHKKVPSIEGTENTDNVKTVNTVKMCVKLPTVIAFSYEILKIGDKN